MSKQTVFIPDLSNIDGKRPSFFEVPFSPQPSLAYQDIDTKGALSPEQVQRLVQHRYFVSQFDKSRITGYYSGPRDIANLRGKPLTLWSPGEMTLVQYLLGGLGYLYPSQVTVTVLSQLLGTLNQMERMRYRYNVLTPFYTIMLYPNQEGSGEWKLRIRNFNPTLDDQERKEILGRFGVKGKGISQDAWSVALTILSTFLTIQNQRRTRVIGPSSPLVVPRADFKINKSAPLTAQTGEEITQLGPWVTAFENVNDTAVPTKEFKIWEPVLYPALRILQNKSWTAQPIEIGPPDISGRSCDWNQLYRSIQSREPLPPITPECRDEIVMYS